jgi:hypothetical protein
VRPGGARRVTWHGAVLVAVLIAVVLAGAGCTAGTGGRQDAAAAPASTAARSSASPVPTPQPFAYALSTHCGVDEMRIGSTYFAADHPLTAEHRAPAGWDNPEQHGTMTLLSPTRAVFRDDRGHEVSFHARAGATSFSFLCD